jgi:hypothetical protein
MLGAKIAAIDRQLLPLDDSAITLASLTSPAFIVFGLFAGQPAATAIAAEKAAVSRPVTPHPFICIPSATYLDQYGTDCPEVFVFD